MDNGYDQLLTDYIDGDPLPSAQVNSSALILNAQLHGALEGIGEGVIFGKDAVARIEIEFPHLRAQMNYEADFGRRNAVAWYGTVAFGVKFPVNTDRLAKIVRITSS